MKIHPLMLCCLFAGTAAVHAAESDPPPSAQISGGAGKTRAEVKAETRQALAAGEITFGDAPYPQTTAPRDTGLTRMAVRGELLRAIAAHEFHFSDTAYPENGIVTTPRSKTRSKTVVATPSATASATPAS